MLILPQKCPRFLVVVRGLLVQNRDIALEQLSLFQEVVLLLEGVFGLEVFHRLLVFFYLVLVRVRQAVVAHR